MCPTSCADRLGDEVPIAVVQRYRSGIDRVDRKRERRVRPPVGERVHASATPPTFSMYQSLSLSPHDRVYRHAVVVVRRRDRGHVDVERRELLRDVLPDRRDRVQFVRRVVDGVAVDRERGDRIAVSRQRSAGPLVRSRRSNSNAGVPSKSRCTVTGAPGRLESNGKLLNGANAIRRSNNSNRNNRECGKALAPNAFERRCLFQECPSIRFPRGIRSSPRPPYGGVWAIV